MGLYAMIGMGAMMGATLQAPLAALLAIVELTGNLNIVLPGMLAIVTASLATKELFSCNSIFTTQMRELGLDHAHDPVMQALRSIAVTAVMLRSVRTAPPLLPAEQASALLESTPQWIVIDTEPCKTLLPAADLARHLASNPQGEVDLLAIPARRLAASSVQAEATLQAGLEQITRDQADALWVQSRWSGHGDDGIVGVVSREQIEAAYRYAPGHDGASDKGLQTSESWTARGQTALRPSGVFGGGGGGRRLECNGVRKKEVRM